MKRKLGVSLIFLMAQLMWLYALPADESGIPFIRNYKADEYQSHRQNWAILQDARGVMYFGSSRQVLEFDGQHWQKVNLDNHSIVRSLAIDSNQTIYVGGINEFGYLGHDYQGKLIYRSLSAGLPEADKDFTNVWSTFATTHGVYFLCREKIFRLHKGTLETLPESGELAGGKLMITKINDGIILYKRSSDSLFVLKDKRRRLLPHLENVSLKDAGRLVILPYSGNKILISTQNHGMFVYDLSLFLKNGTFDPDFSVRDIPPTILQKFSSQLDPLLKRYKQYYAVKIHENLYAFGTIASGILLMDRQGKLIRVINKKAGLNSNTAWFLYPDADQNLWAALNDGIAYIETSSPITQFDERNGLDEYAFAITRHQGTLYVSNITGIHYLPQSRGDISKKKYGFLSVQNTREDCWDFISVGDDLFACGSNVLYKIKGNKAWEKKINFFGYCFGRTPKFPDHIFVGTRNGLVALDLNAPELRNDDSEKPPTLKHLQYGKLKEIKNIIRRIACDRNGDFWITTYYNGIIYIRFNSSDIADFEIYRYDARHGLPGKDWDVVCFVDNRLLVATPVGIFEGIIPEDFQDNPNNLKFVPEKTFGKVFYEQGIEVGQIVADRQVLWLRSGLGLRQAVRSSDGHYFLQKKELNKIRGSISPFHIDPDGIIWYPTLDGLYRFDPEELQYPHGTYNTLIRRIRAGNDSTIFYGNYGKAYDPTGEYFLTLQLEQPESWIPSLSYLDNKLIFEYAATFYEHADASQFSCMLEGFDKNWSAWSSESKKEYTNLPAGDYCFRVKSKNIFDHQGREAAYQFTILPPWYRTVWADIIFGVLIFGVIYGGMVLNSRRLLAAKRRLEKVVTERTRALEAKTCELEERTRELQEKNQQITDSIEYAQKIQEAILNREEALIAGLPPHFIIYHPKDIVSGDFYWFQEVNNRIIIAVVDCTGHGMSGAFMSMIGNTLLNEIVGEQGKYDSAEILQHLHAGVRTALKQDQEMSDGMDGMDVCLCIFDRNWEWVEFSGAKRPLYITRNAKANSGTTELIEVKGERKSVGGIQREEKRTFRKTRVKLQKGDTVYLTSDGFIDQANPAGRRYGTRQLKKLLQDAAHLRSDAQEKFLLTALTRHQKTAEQRDDITIIGIQL